MVRIWNENCRYVSLLLVAWLERTCRTAGRSAGCGELATSSLRRVVLLFKRSYPAVLASSRLTKPLLFCTVWMTNSKRHCSLCSPRRSSIAYPKSRIKRSTLHLHRAPTSSIQTFGMAWMEKSENVSRSFIEMREHAGETSTPLRALDVRADPSSTFPPRPTLPVFAAAQESARRMTAWYDGRSDADVTRRAGNGGASGR